MSETQVSDFDAQRLIEERASASPSGREFGVGDGAGTMKAYLRSNETPPPLSEQRSR